METVRISTHTVQAMNIRTTPFETLYRLEGYLSAQQEIIRHSTACITGIAISAPVWFFVAVILGISGAIHIATIFVFMMPGAFMLAFLLWLCLYGLFFPEAVLNQQLLYRIRHELHRRKHTPFTFVSDN